jgi:hypothetical protein
MATVKFFQDARVPARIFPIAKCLMIHRFIFSASLLIPSVFPAAGEASVWRSADGSRTMEAELVSLHGDTVTMKDRQGKALVFALDKLAAADQERVRKEAEKLKPKPPPVPKLEAFDVFRLGADIDETAAAAKRVPGVGGGLPTALLGRTGINGVYSLKAGGVEWALYFGFDASESLTEVSLYGPEVPLDTPVGLRAHAEAIRPMLTALAGQPLHAQPPPPIESIAEGSAYFSESWGGPGRYYHLGVGKLDGKLHCVARLNNIAPPEKKAEK